ncbi:unnamed protein product [Effrenium voratum]|nr:unnamed protein product [Effrenium voratum]
MDMEAEVARLQVKVQEALEEVHHVRDRVKKMCKELEQVPPDPEEGKEAVCEYSSKLKLLMSSCQSEARDDSRRQEDLRRQIAAEKEELLVLEKEVQQLQADAKPVSQPEPAVPAVSGQGKTMTKGQTPEAAGVESSVGDKLPTDAPEAVPKAKVPRTSLPKPPPPKAKGKAPAPPKAKAKLKAKGSGWSDEAEDDAAQSARLVNLHWRASHGPPEETEIYVGKDGYLQSMSSMMDRWALERAERMRQSIQSFEHRAGLSAKAPERAVPPSDFEDTAPAPGRRRRRTVFNAVSEEPVPELPQDQLEEFFQARTAAFDIGARASCASNVSSLIVDSTHQRMLDLMVRGEAIQRQRETGTARGQTDAVENAVTELLTALERCDCARLPHPVLNDMRKVASSQTEGSSSSIVSFVESRGVEALSRLEHPHLHRLLYGLLRIPAISARLECMAFISKFAEELQHCKQNLQLLRQALLQVCARLGAFRRFWSAALALGNALNEGTAQGAARGFKLASVPKLLELRSPLRREMSLFHFLLLQLRPICDQLCHLELLEALRSAESRRAQTVHTDVAALLESFRHVARLAETGVFRGEKVPPFEAAAGVEDPFHACVREFVEASRQECGQVWSASLEAFQSYRDLGLFFGDLGFVYPPPKDDQDRKKDLFGVLHKFVSDCVRARQEIEDQGLAEQVAESGFQLPYHSTETAPPTPATPAAPLPTTPLPTTPAASPGSPPRVYSPEKMAPPLEEEDIPTAPVKVTGRFGCEPLPLSPWEPGVTASPDRQGPLLRDWPEVSTPEVATPKVGPPRRSLQLPPKAHSPPATPQCPPPMRGPSRRLQGNHMLPGALPTTPGSTGSRLCAEPDYSRVTRKSLTRQADRAAAECIGASAARVRGDSDSASLSMLSSQSLECSLSTSSSASRESSRSRISWDRNADLKTQLRGEKKRRDEWRRRGNSGEGVQLTEAAVRAFNTRAGAVPRTSRTPELSPVRERGETPYRIACQ